MVTTTYHDNNTVAEVIKWEKANSFVSLISLLPYTDSVNEFTGNNHALHALWNVVRDSTIKGLIRNEEEYNDVDKRFYDHVFETEEEAWQWIMNLQ